MVDNGFDVRDNKAEVEAANLSPSQGWIVLRAAEVCGLFNPKHLVDKHVYIRV